MEGFEIAERILRPLVKSIFACVLSTVIGTILVIFGFFLWNWAWDHRIINVFGGLPGYGIQAVFAFFFLIAFGMPLQALLEKFKLNGWHIIVFFGSLAGLCLGAFIEFSFQTEERQGYGPVAWELSHVEWSLYAYGTALGALYSGLAWLIRRPDKDVKPLP